MSKFEEMTNKEQTIFQLKKMLGKAEEGVIGIPYFNTATKKIKRWDPEHLDIRENSVEDIYKVIEPHQNEDSYVNVNLYKDTTSKKENNIMSVQDIYVDLDNHSDTMTAEEKQEGVDRFIQEMPRIWAEKLLLKPSLLLRTGRGLAMHYLLTTPVVVNENWTKQQIKENHRMILKYISNILEQHFPYAALETDMKIINLDRFCRLAGTLNTKAQCYCRIQDEGPTYEYEELLEQFHVEEMLQAKPPEKKRERRNDTTKSVKRTPLRKNNEFQFTPTEETGNIGRLDRSYATHNYRCLKSLFFLRKWEEGTHRNNFCFYYYSAAKCLHGGERAYAEIITMNQQFADPLGAELYTSLNKADEPGNSYYKICPKILQEKLDITPEEAEKIELFRSVQENKKKESKEKRNRIIQQGVEKGYTPKRIHEELQKAGYTISISTVKRQKREFESKTSSRKNVTIQDNINPAQFLSPNLKAMYEKNAQLEPNPNEQEEILEDLLMRSDSLKILGQAGTGKSYIIATYLNRLTRLERRAVCVLSPTGIASENLGCKSSTIHSFLGLPAQVIGHDYPTQAIDKFQDIETVIIDEISMVRIDVMQYLLRVIFRANERYQKSIRIVLVGDYGQLAPVATKEDIKALKEMFPTATGIYAFDAPLYSYIEPKLKTWILTNVRRIQTNDSKTKEYIQKCQQIKYGCVEVINWFNENLSHEPDKENGIYLCAKKNQMTRINQEYLSQFKNHKEYKAEGSLALCDEFEIEVVKRFAPGMRVMVTINQEDYKNGSLGIIENVLDDCVVVRFDKNPKKKVIVTYHNYKDKTGTTIIRQLPLIIAKAITIHKSQGLSLPNVNIIPGCFTSGQLYVALTRCTDISKIHINGKLKKTDLKVDERSLKQMHPEEEK